MLWPESIGLLLLQVGVVLIAARMSAAVLAHVGQPAVIGEMIAGLILGPSVLGALIPTVTEFLFAPAVLTTLTNVSEIGVVLFIFVIGTELDTRRLRAHSGLIVFVSAIGVIVPLIVGAALAAALYSSYGPPQVSMWTFAFFIAVAMSVTAFPVLARIIGDRSMTGHSVAQVALACAAIGDAAAWCLLAAAISLANGRGMAAAATSVLSAMELIRFRGHLPKGGYDVPNGRITHPAPSSALHG